MFRLRSLRRPSLNMTIFGGRLAFALAFGVGAGPVLELVGVEFAVQIGDALEKPCLSVGDRLVVNDGADFFEDEIEQQACGKIADWFREILFEVALNRGDGGGALLLGELDGHHQANSSG